MVAKNVLPWLINSFFVSLGSILGCLASFAAAEFEQTYMYFKFLFDVSPFTWTFTNLFTGASVSIPELGAVFNIPFLSDIISFVNNGFWDFLYSAVSLLGLTKAPFALVFCTPFLLLMIVVGAVKFFFFR